jgi:hypothetical protein
MKIIILSLFMIVGFNSFGQTESKTSTLTFQGEGKTKNEAIYSALENCQEAFFGSNYLSNTSVDGNGNINKEKRCFINSCIIESFLILDEKKISEDKYTVSLKVTATKGNLYLVNKENDSPKYIIFKNSIDAEQYAKYLIE